MKNGHGILFDSGDSLTDALFFIDVNEWQY